MEKKNGTNVFHWNRSKFPAKKKKLEVPTTCQDLCINFWKKKEILLTATFFSWQSIQLQDEKMCFWNTMPT